MLSPPRLSDKAYEITKQRLLDGDYGSGERLSVKKLVTEADISHYPTEIREYAYSLLSLSPAYSL